MFGDKLDRFLAGVHGREHKKLLYEWLDRASYSLDNIDSIDEDYYKDGALFVVHFNDSTPSEEVVVDRKDKRVCRKADY